MYTVYNNDNSQEFNGAFRQEVTTGPLFAGIHYYKWLPLYYSGFLLYQAKTDQQHGASSVRRQPG